ncbi:hypothetical protein LPJ66_002592 [Kickxella alabastrina]|uniref:Uncharacterized protein n=1 Tax=Kickxella alabastrina TaxID=61397 RepID=A0ACC1IQ01_9FUNG|nr:hypothetical protein LPJ66_002592 [Kickxella alabastrina]
MAIVNEGSDYQDPLSLAIVSPLDSSDISNDGIDTDVDSYADADAANQDQTTGSQSQKPIEISGMDSVDLKLARREYHILPKMLKEHGAALLTVTGFTDLPNNQRDFAKQVRTMLSRDD